MQGEICMVLGKYREKFKILIEGPANIFIKLHIHPNQISFLAFLVSILGAICFAFPNLFMFNYTILTPKWYIFWGWVPVLLFGIGGYIDILDGTVARKTNEVSLYGGFLDSTLDRLSDGFIILGLVMGNTIWPWADSSGKLNALFGIIALLVVLLISYVRSRAEIEGVEMVGIGFMERPERVLFILASYLISWIAYCIQTQYFGAWTLQWIFPVLFLIFLILCIYTLIVRVVYVFRWFQKNQTESQK